MPKHSDKCIETIFLHLHNKSLQEETWPWNRSQLTWVGIIWVGFWGKSIWVVFFIPKWAVLLNLDKDIWEYIIRITRELPKNKKLCFWFQIPKWRSLIGEASESGAYGVYARSPSPSQKPAPTTIALRSRPASFPLGLCSCSTSLSKMGT